PDGRPTAPPPPPHRRNGRRRTPPAGSASRAPSRRRRGAAPAPSRTRLPAGTRPRRAARGPARGTGGGRIPTWGKQLTNETKNRPGKPSRKRVAPLLDNFTSR